MALLTVNGAPVLDGTITLPRVGVWHADLRVDSSADISGAATIATNDQSFTLKGTAQLHGVVIDTLSVRLVGGAGGLPTRIGPKAYQGVPLRIVAQDILGACGETLSPLSDAVVLGTNLAQWVRFAGTAESALLRLIERIDTSWRIVPDGTLWIGTDTYPPAPNVPFDVIERSMQEGRAVLGLEQPAFLPGVALTFPVSATAGTFPISAIVYRIEPSSLRAEVWFEKA